MTHGGDRGRLKGEYNERRVRHVFDDAPMPPWLRELVPATPAQDAEGIDYVAHTDVGEIYVQIKSSRVGARCFRRKHGARARYIAIVLVRGHDSRETIRCRLLSQVGELRAFFRDKRR